MDKLKILQELGLVIRDICIQKGLSQAKLGLEIFKDQQSIHKVEAVQFNPSYIYLLEICEGLEIKLQDLLNKLHSQKLDKQ